MKKRYKEPSIKLGKIYYSPIDKYLERISSVFLAICCIFSVCIIAFNMYISPASIIGQSMLPTYNKEWSETNNKSDMAFFSKYVTANKGDVIVVDSLKNEGQETTERFVIKRLIATEGDVVEFRDYKLYVNNEEIDESYLGDTISNVSVVADIVSNIRNGINNWSEYNYSECITNQTGESYSSYVKFTINKGYFFYLGDNRTTSSASYDCSELGPQKNEKLEAKVLFVVPYGTSFIQYWWQKFCSIF